MGRLIRVLLYSLALLLIFLMLSSVFNSCNETKSDMEIQAQVIDNEGAMDDFDEESNEFFEENEEDMYNSDAEEENDLFEDIDDEEPEEDGQIYEEETVEEVATPVESYSPPAQQSTNSGKYTIIAGSFKEQSNAKKMVKKLKAKGFSDANFVRFDGASLYTVTIGGYDTKSSAKSVSSTLSNKGIDNYVSKRK